MPAEYSEPVDLLCRVVESLLRARGDTLPGSPPDRAEVEAIACSQHRLAQTGFDPDRGAGMQPLIPAELEKRRRESQLADLIPALLRAPQGADHSQVTTVHDFAGYVLWRFGSDEALQKADSLGLVEGACWAEDAVGTNAAGTALIERRGLRCIAEEHYVASHHGFACAATPLYDAWDQRLLGVLNVTTLKKNAHPSTLPMVELLARLVEGWARQAHEAEFTPLRKIAWPVLLKLGTPAVVTDRCGHVVESLKIVRKPPVLLLPTQVRDQPFECPQLGGWWVIERLGSGWLWRPTGAAHMLATRVELDVRQPTRWSLTVHWSGTSIRYELTRKYAETLFLLARMPEGRKAPELGRDLCNGYTADSTVRCLLSRMRQEFGHELFDSNPYRFRDHLDVRLNMPDNITDLLPFSTAPAICRIRAGADT
jgi:hypothetical protein